MNYSEYTELEDKLLEFTEKYISPALYCEIAMGLIGNALVCTVILCSKSCNTLTDYYLLNMSIADLLILFVLVTYYAPDELWLFFGRYRINWILEWIFYTAVNVSTWTVTTFTVERYLAICHPFFVQSMPKISRVKKFIIGIWLVSTILAVLSVTLLFVQILPEEDWTDSNVLRYLVDIWAAVCFFIPMLVIIVMYVLIWNKLGTSSKAGFQTNRTDTRTLLMFLIIVAVFFLTWGPYFAKQIMFAHVFMGSYDTVITPDKTDFTVYSCVDLILFVYEVSYSLGTAINPIIYSIMSKKFRQALKDLVSKTSRKLVHCSLKLVPGNTNSNTIQTLN